MWRQLKIDCFIEQERIVSAQTTWLKKAILKYWQSQALVNFALQRIFRNP